MGGSASREETYLARGNTVRHIICNEVIERCIALQVGIWLVILKL